LRAPASTFSGEASPSGARDQRARTQPLDELDLSAETLAVGDSTQPLDLTDVELASRSMVVAARPSADSFANENATMALSANEIAKLAIPPRVPAAGANRLPPPPPRPPAIAARPRRSSAPPPTPGFAARKPQAPVRRPPLPTLPGRAFDTPWEELAVAYESLPAADADARLRWLYRAAEVWETGAKDIVRAFDALARAFQQARRTPAGDAEVRARLYRIANEHRAWDRIADLYEGMAEQAETAAAAADLLTEVASIRVSQKRPRDAEAQLRRILGMLPNDASARARLEELYRSEERWVELAASLEERTDPRLGTAAPEAERPQILRDLAAIYTDKLQRPHDAIDAFERLRVLAPTDIQLLQQLADLFAAVGRWSKVIETLTRLSEIAEGSDEARAALHSIARIYEQELEIADRAIETFALITATWPDDPDAWAALDRLYQQQARWNELAEVLRRRAALERDSGERAKLLARRATVLLEWLDAAEEAAATLRHARTIAPDDPGLADLLVTALLKSGREREAATILESRIADISEGPRRSRGEVAGLHIRLAQLQIEKLDDRAGARASIDAALALVPEHPTALAVLAQLAAESEDPRAFADAKLREAEHAKDDDVQIAALIAAGDALAELSDIAAAARCYERVLALRPYHAEATWALAGLSEKGGDVEAAARVLERKLEDEALTPAEKAALLTQLAALSRAAGVEPAAERRLLEALGTVPDHLPAIVALADLYADAKRWNDLEAFLRQILDGSVLGSAPPALIADLHRRLATAHEKLGRDDDAYQTLVAADRLQRGHLLIKLALGENRYKARRWREAALHLSPLAQHEDAARYPTEVAQGLYHAALAEIRSLRPEKATALYQRALELKPNYSPALQALAELAMEQGDHRGAADLLTRQATATEDPAERLRLFEALGDMAHVTLADYERARTCYAAAVASAQPLEAKHVPLLQKLLELQNQEGDLAGGARTAELMAAFGASAAERAARHLRAAHDYLAAGDKVRARAAAERAVENDPYDVEAVDIASRLAIDQSDVEAASAMLTRLLTSKDERSAATDAAQRALLSYRLGHARAQRGDVRQAVSALERAIALAPESEGAVAARRELVDLGRAGDDPGRREATTLHLAAIAHATGALADLVVWADELRRQNKGEDARAALELAVACGHSADVHQLSYLQINKPYAMRDDEPYRAALDDADRALVTGSSPPPLAQIASTLVEAAALIWPALEETLARAGCAGATRVPASSRGSAVAMFSRLTNVLGAGAVMLYQHDSPADSTVVAAGTPVIVLGRALASDDAGVAPTVIRAHLARAVELTRPVHLAFAGVPPRDATRLLASVVRLFGPQPLRDAVSALLVDEDIQRAHDEVVKGALPVKLRTRLEQLLAVLPPEALDNANYLQHSHRSADRAALLVGGDPVTIVASARKRGDSIEHLVRAIAHPQWLVTRARLGVGGR
jgi:tetratricopeptide (TPR) repeat protein